MTKKEIIATPYLDVEEQTSIGLNDKSWVIITSSTDDSTTVLYFNPEQNPEEFESFDDFVVSYKENEFYLDQDAETSEHKTPKYVSLTSSYAKMEEDFDEDSGKSWEQPVGSALIADIYNGGITKENLPQKIKDVEKSVDDVASEAAEALADGESLRKDPYAYYGVRRSDFY